MKYDFDKIIDRRHTNATSTDGFRQYIFHADKNMPLPYKDEEYIRMWLADMEFATPPCVIEGMKKRLEHPIFGYTRLFDDDLYNAFRAWCEKMYGWTFPRNDLHSSAGIIRALYELTEYICKPDEKVVFLTPSYAFFKHAADFNHVEYVCSDLVDKEHNGYYEVDFEDLRKKCEDPKARLFIFCNPHNPTGRVWTENELKQIGEICLSNDMYIISDEIHCDLLRGGQKHVPLVTLFPETDRIITCMAPSKTFNLAGMHFSCIVFHNSEIQKKWMERHNFNENPLSLAAATAAFSEGYDWMMQLREYLDGNFAFAKEYLSAHLPKATFRIPDATYLGWVDIGPYIDGDTNIPMLFAQQAGVLLEGGNMFVQNSDTYMRLNVSCPRSILAEGLERICKLLAPETF